MLDDDQQRPRAKIQRQDTRSYGIHGPMTFESVTDLWGQSEQMFSDKSVLQIDLADVTRTDSAGLALLIEWLREATRQGGRVEFLNLPPQMLALAEAGGLEHVLTGNQGSAHS